MMVRDYCEHIANFYWHQAAVHSNDCNTFDRFWKLSCVYANRSRVGRPYGSWL